MPIWNSEIETMPQGKLKEFQLEKLKKTIRYTYDNVKFYRNKLDSMKVKPEDIKTLEDIRKLPFTTKNELRENFPYGLFARPMKDVVRIHASSGTTGKPTVVGYTKNDLELWAECIARLASAGGVTSDDIAQISFGYGLFTGGFGLHYGLEKIGAAIIPVSSGNTERQIKIMQDFGSTVLICTPSYALYMVDVVREMGVDPVKDLKLKFGLFGAEPWSESIRTGIEKGFNITATDNYGLSEIIGPGVSGECLEKNGMHINEDFFFIEVIDPETGEWVKDGEIGELVITPLGKEALPLFRYRTRDLSYIDTSKCACGRTTSRIMKIRGRTDDMLIIRGVNIFPSQIEEVLLKIEGVAPHYQIVVERKNNIDTLEVWVETNENMFSDEMKKLVELEKLIVEKLYGQLGIRVDVKLVEPKTIERSQGKAKRVIDNRKLV
ncbi:MAG: phenylacetate--CoA ligase [Spirochaetes bacterium GWF1_51_8]|nr:MAG: phenylacetate--CoA ligase [Spirochaetes bacterium GWF1_51_8]